MLYNLSKDISYLSIFLFIIAGNYAGDLYSCGLRHLFNNYMLLKHIIGVLIMFFFVGILDNKSNLTTKFINTIILYVWYIFIMRSPMIITLITIIIIIIIFIINIYIEELEKKNENNENIEYNTKKIEYYKQLSSNLLIFSFTITLLGTSFFIIYLKKIYKDKFKLYNFLVGIRDQECFIEKNIKIINKSPLFFDFIMRVNNSKKNNEPIKLSKKSRRG
jgi:hypothetical protein